MPPDPGMDQAIVALRRAAQTLHSREDLLGQQRALREFLEKPKVHLISLQGSSGGPAIERSNLALEVSETVDRIRPLFPAGVRAALTALKSYARICTHNQGARAANTPEGVQGLLLNLAIVEGYAGVLHQLLAESREEDASTTNDADGRPAVAGFPTPSGATWEDVHIRFKDGHTVTIRVREARGIYSFAEMGMSNKKNRTFTKQWALLQTFATHDGTLTWKNPEAGRNLQKRREVLAKNLKAFFGIEGDPIRLTNDRKGWQTRFSIRPEN